MTRIQIGDVPYLSEVLEQVARRVQNRELVSSYAANRKGGTTHVNSAEVVSEGREERQQRIADAIQSRYE